MNCLTRTIVCPPISKRYLQQQQAMRQHIPPTSFLWLRRVTGAARRSQHDGGGRGAPSSLPALAIGAPSPPLPSPLPPPVDIQRRGGHGGSPAWRRTREGAGGHCALQRRTGSCDPPDLRGEERVGDEEGATPSPSASLLSGSAPAGAPPRSLPPIVVVGLNLVVLAHNPARSPRWLARSRCAPLPRSPSATVSLCHVPLARCTPRLPLRREGVDFCIPLSSLLSAFSVGGVLRHAQ